MSTTVPHVSLADIREARRLLEGVSVSTAMEDSRWLSAVVGGPVLLKCENLQRTGSFKIRGAYVRMLRLTEEERALGVVAASAGNHAQGVALAAKLLGIKATVFMPEGAPIPKLNATRGYGAEVVFHGAYLDQSLEEAMRFSAETGAVLIHPYDHEDIVAGQGTCGLEIMETCREQGRPDVRVIGVQAEGAAAYPTSLARGRPVTLTAMKTMADGIAVPRPGKVPFAAIVDYVDEVITVSEESLSSAMVMLLERAKMVVEPAGAAAVAAVLDRPHA